MIIGKNFFISEMPKTGSTFLRNYLRKFKNIKLTMHHDTVDVNPKYKLLNKPQRISAIRSPYTWYLSIWRWSCIKKKKSPLYSDLTSRRLKLKRYRLCLNSIPFFITQITKDINNLKVLFSDINSRKNFNKFLTIMLTKKNKNYISSDYSFTKYDELGYMTFFFLTQNVLRRNLNDLFYSNQKFKKIIKIIDKKIYTNQFFKTEKLSNDLKKFLIKNGLSLKEIDEIDKNTTKNQIDKNYIKFFTKKNLKLIEKKEKYIFDKFNYRKISKLN